MLSPHSAVSGTAGAEALSSASESLSLSASQQRPGGSSGAGGGGIGSGSGAQAREIEDLKTKLRLMEKKRMEDRDKLQSLERIQAERDRFESIIQKLQQKYQPQQQEMAELRKQLKAAQDRLSDAETQQADHDVALEMATLDREMAEESAEAMKTELDSLKSKVAELELEVEVLREENQALSEELPPEERESQGWLQMEKSNERLRDALVRLRDITQQSEAELKAQVRSLEEDVQELSAVKKEHEAAKEKLKAAENTIDELRQQLETALDAEEMIEELTERNMNMGEHIEKLKATVADLESLREISDELELNHVETEKQMQEELDYKDSLLADSARRARQQDDAIEEYEYTLARFRELVANLQSDLDAMRASQQITESEAAELTNHSRAMMDLNIKLQTTASKTQIKAIDMELRRLEAQQATEHLAIVHLFLPEAFEAERDPILALLRFKRVAFKAQLLHSFVKERIAGHSVQSHDDGVFAALDVLDKLKWVSAMCDRFSSCMRSCTIEQFTKFADALGELEPVERALNGWIDGLKRDELDEKQCGVYLHR